MTFDPVAYFFAHAARHLARGPHEDAWESSAAVFGHAYPYGMPMTEYAQKTLAQARRAQAAGRRRMLAELARYRIADALISGELAAATVAEREALRPLRDAHRAGARAKDRPATRRPAPGSVVVARRGRAPYTISNVRWASACVEQRWMHEDRLAALIRRLAEDPVDEPIVIAVAGRTSFPPAGLAFSGRRRLAVCCPDRTESVDTARVRRLASCLGEARPRDIQAFRSLCRERALTADIAPIDRKLLRLAGEWGQDVDELHALLLPATDLEVEALTCHREV